MKNIRLISLIFFLSYAALWSLSFLLASKLSLHFFYLPLWFWLGAVALPALFGLSVLIVFRKEL